jgi:hypothetical protein
MSSVLLRRLLQVAAAVSFPVTGSGAAQAGSELHGRVVSAAGAPIGGATITLAGIRYSVRTDSLGRFRFAAPPGSTLVLSLQANGFRDDSASVVLPRGRPVVRDFVLVSEHTPLPGANSSDRVLRGRVTDTDGIPLTYANIQVNGGRRLVTDDSGRFSIAVNVSGAFALLVRRIGFRPEEIKLEAMPDTALRIRMAPVATALPEQRIVGRAAFVSLDRNGFYRRMREAERGATVGYFLTPEDFEFRKPSLITNMAEGIPSIRVERNGTSQRYNLIKGLQTRNALGCTMTVYLDGVRVVGKLEIQDDFINELVNPYDVAAMEVYPRPGGAPPHYQSLNGTCGVVLVWTR